MNTYEKAAIAVAERRVPYFPLSDRAIQLQVETIELALALGDNSMDKIGAKIGHISFLLLVIAYRVNAQKSLQTYIDEAMANMGVHDTNKQDLLTTSVSDFATTVIKLWASLMPSPKSNTDSLIGTCAYLLYQINDAFNDIYSRHLEYKRSIFWRIEDASENIECAALNIPIDN